MNDLNLGLFSYASFSNKKFPSGGWQIGDLEGHINRQVAEKLKRWIPSSLDSGQELSKYPPNDVRERLLRRFAWLPVGISDTGSEWTFFASAFSGYDASGRPGNIYTVVAHSPSGRLEIPAGQLLYSPQIPAPFGPKQVDKAELPKSLNQTGPLTDGVLNLFMNGWDGESPLPKAWSTVEPSNKGPQRRDLILLCRDWLMNGEKVVIACPPEESVLWIATVLSSMRYPEKLSFSTFENPNSIGAILNAGCQITTIPDFRAESARETIESTGARLLKISEALSVSQEKLEFLRAEKAQMRQPEQLRVANAAPYFPEDPGAETVPVVDPVPAAEAVPAAAARLPDAKNPFEKENPFGTESLFSDEEAFGSGFEKPEELSLALDGEDTWADSSISAYAPAGTEPELEKVTSETPLGPSYPSPEASVRSEPEPSQSSSIRIFNAQIGCDDGDEYFFFGENFIENTLNPSKADEEWVTRIIRLNQLLLVRPRENHFFAVLRARLFFLLMRGFQVEPSYFSVKNDFKDLDPYENQMVIAEIYNLVNKDSSISDPQAFFNKAEDRKDIFPIELRAAYSAILNEILQNLPQDSSPQGSVGRSYRR